MLEAGFVKGILVFLFGSLIGSFLNVVIYRFPREKSIVFPGSKCPKCNNNIAWYDNIPIFSWLLLGGKCRYCKEVISARYPMVELKTALLLSLTYNTFDISWQWFFLSYFVCIMVVTTWIDIDHMLVLNSITYPCIITGLVYNIINGNFTNSFFGGLLGFISFYLISKGSLLFLKKEGMGMGDVILVTLLGSWFGIKYLLGSLILSFFLGAFIGIILLIKNKKSEYFPFAPALTVGAMITLLTKNYVFDWYINNFL